APGAGDGGGHRTVAHGAPTAGDRGPRPFPPARRASSPRCSRPGRGRRRRRSVDGPRRRDARGLGPFPADTAAQGAPPARPAPGLMPPLVAGRRPRLARRVDSLRCAPHRNRTAARVAQKPGVAHDLGIVIFWRAYFSGSPSLATEPSTVAPGLLLASGSERGVPAW